MSDKDSEIMEIFRNLLPKLSEQEKTQLLCFGEGMAFKISQTTKDSASSSNA